MNPLLDSDRSMWIDVSLGYEGPALVEIENEGMPIDRKTANVRAVHGGGTLIEFPAIVGVRADGRFKVNLWPLGWLRMDWLEDWL